MKKKITIIIPTLNRVIELKGCLDSIKNQSYKPYELIVVCGKNDFKEVKKLISKFRIKYKRVLIQYLNMQNARNIGLKNFKGEIVIFFDDDTILNKNYLKNIVYIFNNFKNVGGVTGLIKELKIQSIKKSIFGKIMKIYAKIFSISGFFIMLDGIGKVLSTGFITGNFEKVEKITKVQWLNGCNMSYSKEAIEKTGFFNESFIGNSIFEDVDYSYRVYKKGFNLYATPYANIEHLVAHTNREKIPERKYYQLINHKLFFYSMVYNGNISRLIKFKTARFALFFPIFFYAIFSGQFLFIKYYFKAL